MVQSCRWLTLVLTRSETTSLVFGAAAAKACTTTLLSSLVGETKRALIIGWSKTVGVKVGEPKDSSKSKWGTAGSDILPFGLRLRAQADRPTQPLRSLHSRSSRQSCGVT